MKQQTDHLVHDHLEARDFPDKHGKGLFAVSPIAKGETLLVFGGRAVERDFLQNIPEEERRRALQIGEDLFLLQHAYEDGECINHSCDPNAGFVGQVIVVAMRDILPGEEVCFDYAMSDLSDNDEFECHCGAWNCRGDIKSTDWMRADLQERYKGYFTPHVQKMIEETVLTG